MSEAAPEAAPAPAAEPTPDATPTPTPAPEPDPAPTPDPEPRNLNPEPTPDAPEPTPPAEGDFKLPDDHKDKPWASKVKNEADLYKQLDNLSALAGKKNAYPDADATPEQLDEFYSGLKPENAKVYDFGEDHPNPEFAGKVGDAIFDAGISEHQGNKLISSYNALEKTALAEATSAEGFKGVMEKSFGEKYDSTVAAVSKEHKQHLSSEDQTLMDAIPNEYLGMIYRLTNSMQKAYGASEGGSDAHGNQGAAPAGVDIDAQRSELRGKIRALDSGTKPYEQADKDKLINELNDTYK